MKTGELAKFYFVFDIRRKSGTKASFTGKMCTRKWSTKLPKDLVIKKHLNSLF